MNDEASSEIVHLYNKENNKMGPSIIVSFFNGKVNVLKLISFDVSFSSSFYCGICSTKISLPALSK